MSHYYNECRYCEAEWYKNEEHKPDCPLYKPKTSQTHQEMVEKRKPLSDGYSYCI